jgi:hypothetical protein
MIIDTKEEALTLRNTKHFAVIVFSVLIIITVFLAPFDQMVKGIIYGTLSCVFLAFYWFQYQMHYTYFYFSNNSKNLVFRFYSLRFFSGKPKTIEIAKSSFVKYDIVTSFFNKKDSLVLYQKTTKGVAKYPPISLTLLGKKQKTELKRALFAMTNS